MASKAHSFQKSALKNLGQAQPVRFQRRPAWTRGAKSDWLWTKPNWSHSSWLVRSIFVISTSVPIFKFSFLSNWKQVTELGRIKKTRHFLQREAWFWLYFSIEQTCDYPLSKSQLYQAILGPIVGCLTKGDRHPFIAADKKRNICPLLCVPARPS